MSENVNLIIQIIAAGGVIVSVVYLAIQINQQNKNKRLECLAIECNEVLSKNYEINFFFAGGSIITLISESIEVVMNDLGESWNVKYIPKHKI